MFEPKVSQEEEKQVKQEMACTGLQLNMESKRTQHNGMYNKLLTYVKKNNNLDTKELLLQTGTQNKKLMLEKRLLHRSQNIAGVITDLGDNAR